jgi:hypothetical protein
MTARKTHFRLGWHDDAWMFHSFLPLHLCGKTEHPFRLETTLPSGALF